MSLSRPGNEAVCCRIPIKKSSAEKSPPQSKSGNVAPPMVADQEVGTPHPFLTLLSDKNIDCEGRF